MTVLEIYDTRCDTYPKVLIKTVYGHLVEDEAIIRKIIQLEEDIKNIHHGRFEVIARKATPTEEVLYGKIQRRR